MRLSLFLRSYIRFYCVVDALWYIGKNSLVLWTYEGIDVKEIYIHGDNYRYIIGKSLIMSFMIHVADWYLQMTSVI